MTLAGLLGPSCMWVHLKQGEGLTVCGETVASGAVKITDRAAASHARRCPDCERRARAAGLPLPWWWKP